MNNLVLRLKFSNFCNLQRIRLRSTVIPKIKNSYNFVVGTQPLTNITIGDALNHAADVAGNSNAFISAHQGITKTFLELRNEAERLASGLIACGLQKGDRLAIYSPNCYEWPLVLFAAAKAGLILVNLNPAFQASELEYCLKKTGCKAVVSYDKLQNHDYYEVFKKIFPKLSSSNPRELQNKNLPNMKSIIMISDSEKDGMLCLKDVLNSGNKDSDIILAKLEKSIQFDDPVDIQFTSGTTGTPKAAFLSHHSLINNAVIYNQRVTFDTKKAVTCCQVPLFHVYGCVMGVLATVMDQSTCIFPFPGFNSAASLRSIEQYKCTRIYGTPTMYVDLMKTHQQLQTDISSLKLVNLGGATTPDGLYEEIYKGLKVEHILVGYGITETSPAIAIAELGTDKKTVASGFLKPLDYVEIKIIDSNGNIVPLNTQGELCARGHNLFLGYWGDEEKTAEAIDKKRWYHTGDLAVMNEKGFVKIVGRIKDMVIRGGENIYSVEVENFLSTHPAVMETYVVGVPDDRMGEEVCCWISVKPGMTLTEKDIREFCKGKISHFKVPRYILFVEDFPKTTSGKVKKYEMVKISKEKLKL